MSWNAFVAALTRDVSWNSPTFMDTEAAAVEALLQSAYRDYSIVAERIDEILNDDPLYRALEPYTEYPRTLMDKFTLYVHPDDMFRVRLHRFWPTCIAGNAIEKVHYHKWHMSTIILTGSYVERRFEITECAELTRRAVVTERSRDVRVAGGSSSLAARVPHQVHVPSADEPCTTLFVRGPSLQPHARIFNEETGEFYDTYSPARQVRRALECLRARNGVFHPMPETDSRTKP
ncbi:cupin domain-containing protein [Nocardia terpenica]|uniref:Cysteine dioxygenase n=1 Tax=Nocardia terpenica TaxID=455432 RepID=A0A291RYA6_9NOCA|nr:hypothetical protein [Nocardia terpenica]ATL72523.1 hypothetical protein CRH09_39830 [Nocardia terpenica]